MRSSFNAHFFSNDAIWGREKHKQPQRHQGARAAEPRVRLEPRQPGASLQTTRNPFGKRRPPPLETEALGALNRREGGREEGF